MMHYCGVSLSCPRTPWHMARKLFPMAFEDNILDQQTITDRASNLMDRSIYLHPSNKKPVTAASHAASDYLTDGPQCVQLSGCESGWVISSSHLLHSLVVKQQCSFSHRLLQLHCDKERYRKSFMLTAITLYHDFIITESVASTVCLCSIYSH